MNAPIPSTNTTVLVWASLDLDPSALDLAWATLPPNERAEADRRQRPQLRTRFIAARAFLRLALARHLKRSLPELAIDRSSNGKPELAGAGGAPVPQFNLTHADGLALLAINDRCPVGVDIEALDRRVDDHAIAERYFAPAERQGLATLPPEQRQAAFIATWTRKEAFLKGLGKGLGAPLDQFSVSTDPHGPAQLLSVDFAPSLVAEWSLHVVSPPPGYLGTLAVGAPDTHLKTLNWLWT